MEQSAAKPLLLVALGGNALIRKGETGTIAEQFANLKVPARQISRLSRDFRIIVTHGNGPQVGNLLLQQECCDAVSPLPLEILVAQTQGQIGYMIEATLDEELSASGQTDQLLVSLISYVVVDAVDPAFHTPTKPIGPVYTEEESATLPWPVMKTAKGYRRVVASPRPVAIVEKREICKLVDEGFIVICCGGGGIPVVRAGRGFQGVDAVIDKDLASAKLAEEVGVDLFVIATDVSGAATDFGTSRERFLRKITSADAEHYLAEGHFSPGSMGPKVEAAVQFARYSGRRSVISHLDDIERAVAGEAGTEIVG